MAALIPDFSIAIFTARSNMGASNGERQQEGSAGTADTREAFGMGSTRSVIATA